MEHAEVCRRIERTIELQGSLRRAAVLFKVSPQYLSAALAGDRSIGPKLLRALKLRRKVVKVVTYEEATRRA
jgi:hypothetical protein